MSKTLQQILVEDAGGKFPFRARADMWLEDSYFHIVARMPSGAFLGWNENEKMREYGDAATWTFLTPEKPKVLRSQWVIDLGMSFPPWKRYDTSCFVTDKLAEQEGYLRKIPGTEMEFEA